MGNKERRRAVLEELESIAPKLAEVKKTVPPVNTPPHYFEALSADIFRRIREEETRPSVRKNWLERCRLLGQEALGFLFRPSYALALGSVAILLIGAFVFFLNQASPSTSTEIVLSDSDINEYLEAYIDDFELGLLAEEVPGNSEEVEMFPAGDSLEEDLLEDYFDELLDDLELEELL